MPDFLTPKPGDVRSISTNGTVKSAGEQREFSNGWAGRGTLGTVAAGKPTIRRSGSNTNRTGEGGTEY